MRRNGIPSARLVAVPGGYEYTTSYDVALIAAFKARIPAEGREWDKINRRWLVDAQYAGACVKLAEAYLGITLTVPPAAPILSETRLIELHYLGRCKDREGSEPTAYGYAEGAWSTVWPEAVLRAFFEVIPQPPGERPTLYGVLGVKPEASTDEVRSAYRRLARQWHPDICHDPDAAEQFKIITNAYQVLTNEALRRKYEAGLVLERSLHTNSPAWDRLGLTQNNEIGYRAPLKCGLVLVEGKPCLSRFVISRIARWEDVVRADGKVMVTSWPRGADMFEVRWQ